MKSYIAVIDVYVVADVNLRTEYWSQMNVFTVLPNPLAGTSKTEAPSDAESSSFYPTVQTI